MNASGFLNELSPQSTLVVENLPREGEMLGKVSN
jgi:hypothetical protein